MDSISTNTSLLTSTPNTIHISASEHFYPRFTRLQQMLLSLGMIRLFRRLTFKGFFTKRVRMPAGTIAGLESGKTYYVVGDGKQGYQAIEQALISPDCVYTGKIAL